MLFNFILGRKKNTSVNSVSCRDNKHGQQTIHHRQMSIEPLESRDLLSVTPCSLDETAYEEIRASYPDFELPELQTDINVMTIAPDGSLSLDDLKNAIAAAGESSQPDLILVQTSTDANSVSFTSSSDMLTIDIDSTQYGSVTIIGLGSQKFTLNANNLSRVMNVSGDSTVVNLGGLTIQNGTADNGGGIYIDSGTVTISNCTISNNTSTGTAEQSGGGGIYNKSGDVSISNSVISKNKTTGTASLSGGGGIYNNSGTITISNSEISQNSTSKYGGGMSNNTGTLTVSSSTIVDNNSTLEGGGIKNEYGNVTVTDSSFLENQSKNGGAAFVYKGFFSLNNVSIIGNTATNDGGGMYIYYADITVSNSRIAGNFSRTTSTYEGGGGFYNREGNLSIADCEISGNASLSEGGGVLNSAGILNVSNCTIANNSSSKSGAGVYNYNSSAVSVITNSKISNNTATNYSGGIHNYTGDITVINSLITGNKAQTKTGGGIYNSSGTVNVTNCTIAGNFSLTGGSGVCRENGSVTIVNSIVSHNYSDNVSGELTSNSRNNLFDNNDFEFLCYPLFDNNGNLVNADAMDLHLRSDSTAVDSGDNTAIENNQTDLDGKARIYGDTVDLGAYEYQGDRNDSPIIYSSVVNTLNDSFNFTDNEWSLREAIYFAPENASITFADDLEGTIHLVYGELEIEKPLSIDGNERIVIDADQRNRVLFINAGSNDAQVVLDGLMIQKGYADAGGGIYIQSGDVSVFSCVITENIATTGDGGGINNENGVLTVNKSTISNNVVYSKAGGGIANSGAAAVSNSVIKNNTAYYGGGINNNLSIYVYKTDVSNNVSSRDSGGIRNWQGELIVDKCTINGNKASQAGGGVYSYKGNANILDSEIKGNISNTDGGGIRAEYSGSMTVTNCVISNNNALRNGGGFDIYNNNVSLLLVNSVVTDNTSGNNGGGIAQSSSSVTINNSVISRNSASNVGGGISNGSSATTSLVNTEISGNSCSSNGGGLYVAASATITNCTISGNSSTYTAGGIYKSSSATLDMCNSIVSLNVGYNCFYNIFGVLSNNSHNNLIGYYSGFVCAPSFDADGNLTNADEMDLRLRSDSAAIDKGYNFTSINKQSDRDGLPRVYGDSVDIGAYEYQGDRNDEPFQYSSVVNTLKDSFDLNDNEWSLREAIYYASEYATITFAEGLEGAIQLTQGQLVIDKALTIDGDNRIAVDGNQKSRVFLVREGTRDIPTVLTRLTIQNGNEPGQGGGIYNKEAFLTVSDCTIINNVTPERGGGICCEFNGNLTVINSRIMYNSAETGGGIYVQEGKVTVSNSEISRNLSNTDGGGIRAENSGIVTVTNSVISNNTALNNGGGMDFYANSSLQISNSVVTDNVSRNYGGGIAHAESSVIIDNCIVSRNSSSDWAGGIYSWSSSVAISNSEISGNSCGTNGGGIFSNCSSTIVNCTIAGNSASDSGGGIFIRSGSLTLKNSIVSQNIGVVNNNDLSGSLSSNSGNNLIGVDDPGFVNSPEFNSEGVLTNSDAMDLHLLSDSPAIDNGNISCAGNYSTDVEGNLRIFGNSVDIGAYEYQGSHDVVQYNAVVNTLNDSFDPNDDEWSLREAIYYASEYVTITFADELDGTIELTKGQLVVDKALTIDGENRVTIDAKQNNRGIYVSAGSEDEPVVLKKLTIQNGTADNGGGVYINDGVVTISNCTISGNTATGTAEQSGGGGVYNYSGVVSVSDSVISNNKTTGTAGLSGGGGIYNNSGTLTVSNCEIYQNSSSKYGGGIGNHTGTLMVVASSIINNNSTLEAGGIKNEYGSIVVTDSTIQGNTSKKGGAALIFKGSLYVYNCSISENTASDAAGGIYNSLADVTVSNSEIIGNISQATNTYNGGGGFYNRSGNLSVSDCVISGNSSKAETGGILNYGGVLHVTNCSILDNSAVKSGAGIYNYSDSAVCDVTNSRISNNTSAFYGGGIYNYSGSVDVINSLLTCNKAAARSGGGINNSSGTVTITNCTIAGNYSYTVGSGVCREKGDVTIVNSIVSNNFRDNVSGDISASSCNNIIGNYYCGLICVPAFDSEGNLVNADSVDLHLRSDSIAIDSGDDAAVENVEADLEGKTRLYGNTVDIGAYEYQGDRNDPPVIYSSVVNTLNDSFDLSDNEWSLREALYYASEYVNITFADGLEGTIYLLDGQLDINKPLSIDGDNCITIDAEHNSRIFNIDAGTKESSVDISNLTIQNGSVSDIGGGVLNISAKLNLTNCVVSGNESIGGGGVYNFDDLSIDNCQIINNICSGTAAKTDGGGIYNKGTLSITNSYVTGNSTTFSGGGIFNNGTATVASCIISENSTTSSSYGGGGIHNYEGSITLLDSVISGNISYNGGGVYIIYGSAIVDNCEISNNSSNAVGGGIRIEETVDVTITNSVVSNNTALSNGGGIDLYHHASMTLSDCTVSNNTSQRDGGGISFTNSNTTIGIYSSSIVCNSSSNVGGGIIIGQNGTTILVNTEISGNLSSNNGGGIYNKGVCTTTNCTIAANDSASYGGGVCNSNGTFNSYNSIIASNTATGANDLYLNSGSISGYNNLSTYSGWDLNSNYFYNQNKPLFLNVSLGKYSLARGSQAIDKGYDQYANNAGMNDASSDLAGAPRFNGNSIDLGAYESDYDTGIVDFVPVVSVQANDYSNTDSIPHSVDRLTDWDSFYLELWSEDVSQFKPFETFDLTVNYNPNLFNLDTTQEIGVSDGVTAVFSNTTVESDGTVTAVLTLTISEDGYSAPGQNTYWGSILFTPNLALGAGVGNALSNDTIGVLISGNAPDTALIAMPYDFDYNNVVNVDDFIAFASVYGYRPDSYGAENPLYIKTHQADFDGSGVVDVQDFISFATNFGLQKGKCSNIQLPQRANSDSSAAVPAYPAQIAVNDSVKPQEENVVVLQPQIELVEPVVTILDSSIEYQIPTLPALSAAPSVSVQAFQQAYSSALLDLYDNQNEIPSVTKISAAAIDKVLLDRDEFGCLFDDLDSDADDNSSVDLSVVLDELELELL